MGTQGSRQNAGWLVYAAARRDRSTAVMLPWERRGDFQRLCAELTGGRRLAWRRVKRRTLDRHLALVDGLAGRAWLRVGALERIEADGRPVRLRVDAADDALANRTPPGVTVKVAPRKTTAGLQVARFLASALALPEGDMSPAQRKVAAAVRARWAWAVSD